MQSFLLRSLVTIPFLLSALVAGTGRASWDVSSSIDLTTRTFFQDARWEGQDDTTTQFSLGGTVDARWRGEDSRASIIPYVRWDETDDERSLVDLREGYWAREGDSYELLVGVNTVFWGVTESRHLVDIINQTDAVADIDREDKLGQPMINLEVQRDWGLVSAYLLPYFRERTFAGREGRLRTPLPVDADAAQYESSAEENHLDLALRYSHYVGSFDVGLSMFRGTSREPRLLADDDGDELIPYYDQITQLGLDLQYTGDAWLWKLEAIARETQNDEFSAAVGGFEYTLYQVADTSSDLGLLLELQYDGRDDDEPPVLADNDLFAALRFTLNDAQDTSVLAGMGYDLETSETYINIEADRRVGENTTLELRARFFTNADPSDTSYAIEKDDYLQLQLSQYF